MKATDGRVRPLGTSPILSPQLRSSSVVAALAVNLGGQILAVNEYLLRLMGRSAEDLIGQPMQALVLARPEDWTPWREVAKGGKPSGVELQLKCRDGRTVFLRGDIARLSGPNGGPMVSGLFVDATAGRHLETSITHASRMEAVASVTSGIAHDFSNLLTVLVGNLYLISEGVRENKALFEKTKLARDAARRGTDLVRQLLTFARNEWAESATVDPAKIVSNLEPLLKRAMGSRISLNVEVASEVSAVAVNAAQLESALVNLVVNSRDAIEGSGKITVGVANSRIDETNARAFGVQSGNYVRIVVQDSGAGIPEELKRRVFEPFFSTKGEGKGTGLGLAMVRLFAIQAKGAVLLESERGVGTRVTLLLPCSLEPPDLTGTNTMPLAALPSGRETILVFAEDDDVRNTLQEVLVVLGYTVLLGDGFDGSLATLRSRSVQLVLIDIKSIPGSSGIRLLQFVKKINPALPIVVIRDSIPVHHAGIATLQKPFDLKTVATTIRRALDGGHDER